LRFVTLTSGGGTTATIPTRYVGETIDARGLSMIALKACGNFGARFFPSCGAALGAES
jgi:hypothetical protein